MLRFLIGAATSWCWPVGNRSPWYEALTKRQPSLAYPRDSLKGPILISLLGALGAKKVLDRLPQAAFRGFIALFLALAGVKLLIWPWGLNVRRGHLKGRPRLTSLNFVYPAPLQGRGSHL